MEYRRLFIMRKDLNLSPGKLSAQVAHCAEAYWTRIMRNSVITVSDSDYTLCFTIDRQLFDNYVDASFVKTICEAKNKAHLLKAKKMADDLGLKEGADYGLIYDSCRTELKPEEDDGTTLTGMWFCPLPTEVVHKISKKYHLYV